MTLLRSVALVLAIAASLPVAFGCGARVNPQTSVIVGEQRFSGHPYRFTDFELPDSEVPIRAGNDHLFWFEVSHTIIISPGTKHETSVQNQPMFNQNEHREGMNVQQTPGFRAARNQPIYRTLRACSSANLYAFPHESNAYRYRTHPEPVCNQGDDTRHHDRYFSTRHFCGHGTR